MNDTPFWMPLLAEAVGRRLDHDVFEGTPHAHHEYVDGCFRCDLSRDEVDRIHPDDPTRKS